VTKLNIDDAIVVHIVYRVTIQQKRTSTQFVVTIYSVYIKITAEENRTITQVIVTIVIIHSVIQFIVTIYSANTLFVDVIDTIHSTIKSITTNYTRCRFTLHDKVLQKVNRRITSEQHATEYDTILTMFRPYTTQFGIIMHSITAEQERTITQIIATIVTEFSSYRPNIQ